MSEKRKSNKPATRPAAGAGPMDVNLLEQIVKLMAANDLGTVELRDGDRRITLRRGPEPMAMPQMAPQYAAPVAGPPPGTTSAPSGATPAATEATEEDSKLLRIKSPMVGTFYAAPSKGAKPFVTVGSRVDEDTDVCIIEAMKVFNNIKPDPGTRGTIARILIQDSQPVEFGQVLFLVKPE